MRPLVLILLTALLPAACSGLKSSADADVIVVGAGIAGLSAALEAADQGASVMVLEINSVGGGHAVKAGGFALVDTALQRKKGIKDSPDLAWADLLRWGEDPDPYWSRRYAEESGPEVYDWLTQLGVNFRLVLDTPEDTVPRFHFTRGTAVHAVVPMMREALSRPNIRFSWNTRVTDLMINDNRVTGVLTRNERSGIEQSFRSNSVILSTGGFQNNLDMVRANWGAGASPEQIYKGAGHFATGDGYRLAAQGGSAFRRMDRQVTFYGGIPNPRDPDGGTGHFAQNPAAVWLDNHGRRFVNETADSKTIETAVTRLESPHYWMVFDAKGSRRFNLRGSPWITKAVLRREFLDNPDIVLKAASLEELAKLTGLPEHDLTASIQIWNRMLFAGTDYQFGRFSKTYWPRSTLQIEEPPFYAVRLSPLTRKSMGGPAINNRGQVITETGAPVAGLYAAGELTGVAGINGSHGGSGTFLGPSVLTGRIAGRAAALSSEPGATLRPPEATEPVTAVRNFGEPGYWHYDVVHQIAADRAQTCDNCHNPEMPMAEATTAADMLARLDTCTSCH